MSKKQDRLSCLKSLMRISERSLNYLKIPICSIRFTPLLPPLSMVMRISKSQLPWPSSGVCQFRRSLIMLEAISMYSFLEIQASVRVSF